MSPIRFQVDHAGVDAWLKENTSEITRAMTEQVAEQVRAEASSPVTVKYVDTDRSVGVVMHHFAYASEVKHARLARAAIGHGLELGPPGNVKRGAA